MKRLLLISLTAITIALCSREVSAFWGTDSKDNASGLDMAGGFDVNTVSTLTGRVVTLPEATGQKEHTVMGMSTLQGNVSVLLGPWWYWERQTIAITSGDEIAVTGSRAQGKDGSMYVFAQRIENPTNGQSVSLRSETGQPYWSRAAQRNKSGTNSQGGSGSATRGAGSRGGGMRGGRH